MQDDYKKLELFTRRAFLIGVGKLSLTGILLGKLAYLQVLKNEEYFELSEGNRSKRFWVKPLRGKILDRSHRVLADNIVDYKLFLDRVEYLRSGRKLEPILREFYKILALDEKGFEAQYKKIKKQPSSSSIEIFDRLTWDQVSKIEFNLYKIPGAFVDIEYRRNYVNPSCSNFLGYIGEMPESEAKKLEYGNIIKVGKNGIEQKFDEHLRGEIGYRQVEVDSRGVEKNLIEAKSPKEGNELKLAIDIEVQDRATKILADQSASAVVMDVANGEILAMVSTPGFNSNDLVKGLSSEDWKKLTDNTRLPLTNKAVSQIYPPGSVFKPIVALAALESGISKNEQFYCKGYYQLGQRKFGCWNKNGHGYVDMHKGILQSCNCYFYQLALKTGIEPIKKYASMLGFGEKPFTELPNVQSGIMPDRHWKHSRYKQSWSYSDTLNCSIGQGYVMTSPLQLCLMYSRILSGKLLTPTMLFNSNSETWLKKITLSPFGQIVLYELIQSEISITLPFAVFSIGRCKESALIFRFET